MRVFHSLKPIVTKLDYSLFWSSVSPRFRKRRRYFISLAKYIDSNHDIYRVCKSGTTIKSYVGEVFFLYYLQQPHNLTTRMNNVHLILLVSFIKIYFVDTFYFAEYIYFFLHALRLHDSCGIHWFSFPLGHSSLMIPISSQYCRDFKN